MVAPLASMHSTKLSRALTTWSAVGACCAVALKVQNTVASATDNIFEFIGCGLKVFVKGMKSLHSPMLDPFCMKNHPV